MVAKDRIPPHYLHLLVGAFNGNGRMCATGKGICLV